MRITIIGMCVVLGLSGCTNNNSTFWHNKSDDYRHTQQYPALFVPPPFEKQTQQSAYAVQPLPYEYSQERPDIRPPDLR